MKGLSYKDVQRLGRISGAITLAVIAGWLSCKVSALPTIERYAQHDDSSIEAANIALANSNPGDSLQVSRSDEVAVAAVLMAPARTAYDQHYSSFPEGGKALRYRKVDIDSFNDSNAVHLQAAEALGIEPVTNVKQAWHMRKPIVRVVSTKDYYVDSLTHSLPYLVPKAENLLADIGRAFRDSLEARGGGDYRIKVTSILRTPDHIADLCKGNVNSVETSAHLYGTTFDISYGKFICDSPSTPRTQGDLKGLLMEVLDDLRKKERCYVKSEGQQACFHITVR